MSAHVYDFFSSAPRCVRCENQSGFAVERGMRGKEKRSGPSLSDGCEGETTRHCVTRNAATMHK